MEEVKKWEEKSQGLKAFLNTFRDFERRLIRNTIKEWDLCKDGEDCFKMLLMEVNATRPGLSLEDVLGACQLQFFQIWSKQDHAVRGGRDDKESEELARISFNNIYHILRMPAPEWCSVEV